MYFLGGIRLPGIQIEIVVPDSFRLLVVLGEGRPLGNQIELVVPDGCRSLFVLGISRPPGMQELWHRDWSAEWTIQSLFLLDLPRRSRRLGFGVGVLPYG